MEGLEGGKLSFFSFRFGEKKAKLFETGVTHIMCLQPLLAYYVLLLGLAFSLMCRTCIQASNHHVRGHELISSRGCNHLIFIIFTTSMNL